MDLKKGDKFYKSQSPLGDKSQIQSIGLHQAADVLITGSFDGRVAVSPVYATSRQELDVDEEKSIFFQTHFHDTVGPDNKKVRIMYPITAVGFSLSNVNWLYAASSNKKMMYLDYAQQRKVKSL